MDNTTNLAMFSPTLEQKSVLQLASTPQQTLTLATSYFMKSKGNFDEARSELYSLGIKTSYNDDVVIFSTLHNNKINLDNAYLRECNGLVLNRHTYKPLVVPPRTLRFNIDTNASNVFLHQGFYHIYKAADGTCFNLYYFNGKWVISTAKGHTMNDVKWDSKTYQETISECLETIGLTWEKFTDTLNPKRSYSFGFSHPGRHKFMADVPKLWFIQSVVTDESSETYLWASDQTPIELIPTQERYTTPVLALKDLYRKVRSALEDYLATGEVCFGFILRSVNPGLTKNHSDLFIESSLMCTIRRFWYENSIIEQCHKNGWNMEKAVTLNAYLNTKNRDVFVKLFPQYAQTFQTYAVEIDKIVSSMVDVGQNKLDEAIDLADKSTAVYTPKITAAKFLKMFRSTVPYSINDQTRDELAAIYESYVCHPDSLGILMNAW
jgi:hypothetical protein